MNTNYLLSTQQYDDSGMRRALSAPDFVKVKSKLQTKIKNRMNPLFTKNRPHMPSQSISPKSSCNNNSNLNNNNNINDNDNEEIPASVLAAGPSLRLKNNSDNNDNSINQSAFTPTVPSSIIAQTPHAYPFNQTFNKAHLQSLLLNVPYTQSQPYLNSFQIQALFQAAALDANALSNSTHATSNPLKDHVTSFSMSSLSNRDPVTNNHIKRQRTSEPSIPQQANSRALFIPQYGNRTLIQEENEMLLANEFKDANKIDEKIQNAFMYGDDDENDDEEDDEDEIDNVHSYKNPADHGHPKHMLKKISCYSDPYLMKSNLHNLVKSKDNTGSNNRLNDRRGTLHAENENEMEFASNDRSAYKYTTGKINTET